ncbi:MAG: YggT family protein [Methylococcaceae bacterium]|nr:YggT family protein [Methylococcaceae bacterium]MDZ4155866.1 YggT family protein [Methylococcales bacterium]MDP2391785.1 YggT family protein [Methylococcaceae bacterium]MDP3018976.1 YggT family protein [Methylococcaceae bacterium]MDP3391537.1 YggT family protein [Methylococcaceae bacterium]
MGSSYMTDPVIFIIDTVISLYILAVMLRFLLQWSRADFYNPISQFLVKVTHPPLKLLRRFIPAIGKIDTSSLVLMLAIQMLDDLSIRLLIGASVGIGALAISSITQLIELLINVFIYAVFARAILSWINPGSFHAASSILVSLTEPLLNTCRKIIPDLGGIDLSPLAVLMLLQLAKMVLLPPLHQLASLIS